MMIHLFLLKTDDALEHSFLHLYWSWFHSVSTMLVLYLSSFPLTRDCVVYFFILQLLPECHRLVSLLIAQLGLFATGNEIRSSKNVKEFAHKCWNVFEWKAERVVSCYLHLFWTEYILNYVDILNWEMYITEEPSKNNSSILSYVSLNCINIQ